MKTPAILRSFKLRITLLSVLLSGLVLVVFAVAAWWYIQRLAVESVDYEIKSRAHRHLSMPQPPEHWRRFEDFLRFMFSENEEGTVILLVKSREGDTLYASPNWPEELSSKTFVPPPETAPMPFDGFLEPPPPPGGNRPGFGRRGPPQGEPRPGRGFGPPQGPPPPMPVFSGEFLTLRAGQRDWRIGVMGNPDVTLVMGMDLSQTRAEMGRIRNALLVSVPVALLLIAVGGWFLSKRALRPVMALTWMTENITSRALDQRIPLMNEDAEFERLINVFNQMLDRLETSFQQAVRFSADAAHELKTPLTILQGELEQALQRADTGSEQQRLCGSLLEEVQRLRSIIRKLLLLSLVDAGELQLSLRPLDLSALLAAVVEDLEILATQRAVTSDITPDLWVRADADLIKQVIQNLTGNAVKYSEPGGTIHLSLRQNGPNAVFTITNTGKGIPPEDRDKVFDRFYRADKARSRAIEGTGLGLSLAREIVRAHHGELILANNAPGTTVFRMTLERTNP